MKIGVTIEGDNKVTIECIFHSYCHLSLMNLLFKVLIIR